MFRTPLNILLYSQTSGGKTTLALDLISRPQLFDKRIDEITYVYSMYNPRFKLFPHVKFVKQEIPELKADGKTKILICDDLLINRSAMDKLITIFLVSAHHSNTTVIINVQQLTGDKRLRTLSINTHVFFLFSHLRDTLSINTLFSQTGLSTDFLKKAYKLATKKKYSYLGLDLQSGTSESLRVFSNVLNENPSYFLDRELETPYAVSFNE